MQRITLQEAHQPLPQLLAILRPGEAVQITNGDKIIARLIVEPLISQHSREFYNVLDTVSYANE